MTNARVGKQELHNRAWRAMRFLGKAREELLWISVRAGAPERDELANKQRLFETYTGRAIGVASRLLGGPRGLNGIIGARESARYPEAVEGVRGLTTAERKRLWLEFRAEIETTFAEADRLAEGE